MLPYFCFRITFKSCLSSPCLLAIYYLAALFRLPPVSVLHKRVSFPPTTFFELIRTPLYRINFSFFACVFVLP